MSDWISVDDELPCIGNGAGESENVLIATDFGEVMVGFYCHEEGLWSHDSGDEIDLDIYPITHWQPLPLPPQ